MLFERFEVSGLSHFSYALGCPEQRVLAVIDPERNINTYTKFAEKHGMRITHVLETHIHADYVSGAAQLAARTGATLAASKFDDGQTYTLRTPHHRLGDREIIDLGSIRVQALHTPGHTPEHMSFLVFADHAADSTPTHMLTGDFLFVGSLGRPDLLGEEATRQLAKQLFASVKRLRDLPGELIVCPGHGAGSFCGAGMSNQPTSTLAEQRASNPYLNPALDEDAFVQRICDGVPLRPAYYARMKQINSDGPCMFEEAPGMKPLRAGEAADIIEHGGIAIDLRKQADFASGHIPGSLGIGIGPNMAVWAALTAPYEAPLVLVPGCPHDVEHAARTFARVGLDNIVGHLEDGMEAWYADDRPVDELELMDARTLHSALSRREMALIDIRRDEEFASGHVHGAMHFRGETLATRLNELPDRNACVAIICRAGYRSVVAASLLRRAGFTNVIDVAGGMQAWMRAGLPLERGTTA